MYDFILIILQYNPGIGDFGRPHNSAEGVPIYFILPILVILAYIVIRVYLAIWKDKKKSKEQNSNS